MFYKYNKKFGRRYIQTTKNKFNFSNKIKDIIYWDDTHIPFISTESNINFLHSHKKIFDRHYEIYTNITFGILNGSGSIREDNQQVFDEYPAQDHEEEEGEQEGEQDQQQEEEEEGGEEGKQEEEEGEQDQQEEEEEKELDDEEEEIMRLMELRRSERIFLIQNEGL
jgi:nucleosome binding factor SPN SPT16 subunit